MEPKLFATHLSLEGSNLGRELFPRASKTGRSPYTELGELVLFRTPIPSTEKLYEYVADLKLLLQDIPDWITNSKSWLAGVCLAESQ